MSQPQHNLVVRNTFIDAVPDADVAGEAEEDPLFRSQSDPTGGRSKLQQTLPRLDSIHHSAHPQIVEGTRAQEAGEEDPPPKEGEEEDDEDDLLVRTTSRWQATPAPPPIKPPAPPAGLVAMAAHAEEEDEDDECAAKQEDEADEDEDEDDDSDDLLRTRTMSRYPGQVSRVLPSTAGGASELELSRLVGDDGDTAAGDLAQWSSAQAAAAAANAAALGLPYPWPPAFPMPWWPDPSGYPMYNHMYPPMVPPLMPRAPPSRTPGADGHEESSSSTALPVLGEGSAADVEQTLPALGRGSPLGTLHQFHQETSMMGNVSHDFRQFTKVGYEGRLSVVSEARVHTDGTHRYLVQFTAGDLSRADGVGFIFSPRLPCAKNIQRIVSIFVNQRGRICMRVFQDIVRASSYIKPIELGDWVELAINLDEKVVTFNKWAHTETGWPALAGEPDSTAEFQFGNRLGKLNQAQQKQVKLNVGHLACVVKNVGVTITLAS